MSDTQRGFRQLPNGDVQLTMQPHDYDRLLLALGAATVAAGRSLSPLTTDKILGLCNRLFDGSPAYKPYRVSARERDHPYEEAVSA